MQNSSASLIPTNVFTLDKQGGDRKIWLCAVHRPVPLERRLDVTGCLSRLREAGEDSGRAKRRPTCLIIFTACGIVRNKGEGGKPGGV